MLTPHSISELNEIYARENWLLDAGVITAYSVDVLLGYAYMQRGVKHVQLEVSPGDVEKKLKPYVMFKLTLDPKFKKKYEAMYKHKVSGTLWGKWRMYRLVKAGIPLPEQLEKMIEKLARDYLPKSYEVFVNVVG